jgi:Zn-dependent protease
MESLLTPLIAIVILIFSAILHEVAHGYAADRLGDPTARLLGRLTLNPVKHIDPIMSILLPVLLFFGSGGTFVLGGAKPVPIDPFNLKDGRKDIALVSASGPLTNVLIAIIAAAIFNTFFSSYSFFEVIYSGISFTSGLDFFALFVALAVHINILLAVFNLLPIPPLDGSKIFSLILPESLANTYLSLSSIGLMIIFFLLFFPIGGFSLSQFIFNLILTAERLLGL